jgi:hypothetical protein
LPAADASKSCDERVAMHVARDDRAPRGQI